MNQPILTELNSMNLIIYVLFQGYCLPEELSYLNLTQERILITVREHKNTSMHEIARFIGLERGPFSQVVTKLEKLGLLERKRLENDRRTVHLSLSAKGKEITDKIQQHMQQHFSSVLSSLSSQEQKKLFESFVTLRQTAEKLLSNNNNQ